MEQSLALVLAGLWGILLLIFAIRAGRSIITLDEEADENGAEEAIEDDGKNDTAEEVIPEEEDGCRADSAEA